MPQLTLYLVEEVKKNENRRKRVERDYKVRLFNWDERECKINKIFELNWLGK